MNDGMADIIAELERKRATIDKALAALKEVDEFEAPAGAKRAKPKGGITSAGRKRLSEAMKQRWAARKGKPAVKKATRRKTVAENAA